MGLTILTGHAALHLAESQAIQSAWKVLHARCPWATACQHPDFVLPWYRLYSASFEPVVVIAYSSERGLQGLLPLARRNDGVTMTGAGERQAEYHAWLAEPDAGDGFIRAAVAGLHAAFPTVDLFLKYLPPGTPLGWTVDAGSGDGRCVMRAHRRPLMHIDAAAMTRQRNKKNHRQNFNRLSRIGEVAFEQVQDDARFIQVLDDIVFQYDFRQGALHQQKPFHADPMKKSFLLALHRQGLLHTTILTVNGELAASHVGLMSQGRALHLGLNTHAPGLASHSPGQLLLAMLGEQLAREGTPLLDLTAGGDGYKEQLATGHDLAFELTLYGSAQRRLQGEMRAGASRWARAAIRAAGYRSTDVLALAGALRCLPGAGLRRIGAGLRETGRSPGELRCQLDGATRHPGDAAVSKNRVADALLFDGGSTQPGYWRFLRLAMQRMERAQLLYSLAQGDKLLLCCWVAADDTSRARDAARPGSSMCLSDLYVHPDAASVERLRGFLLQVVYDLQEQGRGGELRCNCNPGPELRRAFHESGFVGASDRALPAAQAYPSPRSWEPGS